MSTNFYDLKISKIQKETEDALSISFSIPEDLKKEFQYKQGQYLTLKFDLNGKEQRRAYSMSSSPLEKDLTVTVKRVQKGLVSTHMTTQLAVGTTVAVMPPQGRFFTPADVTNRKNYYMIGAGSGITPLLSMIKTIVETEPQSVVYLLYSNRNEESIIFKQQLDELQTRYVNQLYVEHILSQPKREKSGGLFGVFSKGTLNWQGKVGRISEDVLEKWLQDAPKTHKQSEVFICGPDAMMKTAEKTMLGKGFDATNIHTEHFSSVETEKSENLKGAKVNVQLRGESIDFVATEGKTILEMLIDLKKDAPYSCTSGACSTCIAKVTKGTVKMDACYALDDDEVAAGYILTCQAHPTSSEVEITYE
jgi:ring-1,2-phenylacetyl-CoA epoxidase subunit PaaE